MTLHLRLAELDQAAFRSALPRLLEVYTAAMGYPPGTSEARAPLWGEHSRRVGFRCVVCLGNDSGTGRDGGDGGDGDRSGDADRNGDAPSGGSDSRGGDEILALAYGYHGRIGQWWYTEVARGLGPSGSWWLHDYFELTELHVRPGSQGRGIGETVLRQLLAPVTAQGVLLSTPEGENRAWRLYRRLGFRDVLRGFLFTGDSRPFGVLGRSLPLDPPA